MSAALIEAYLDESGTHKGSTVLSVAGYFGSHRQWCLYLNKWPYRDFHASQGRYDNLKPELAAAIDVAELHGAEVCIRLRDFDAIANAAFRSHLGNAYATAAFMCAAGICDQATALESNARIAFVLEDGQPNVRWVQRLLIGMMAMEYPIAAVTVVQKRDFPQLHAADLLAHSRSTSNHVWMDRLFEHDRVKECAVEPDLLMEVSAKAANALRQYRNTKAKQRRERRMNK